ncbi:MULTISPECIES: restriction endonuclease subunit S [unclassified Nostoc]|uniref:restriction endonuclease subunit S n=1 Tax=unclassified Nostoc TaxID=2593658 RepID=UPI0028C4935A|nr:MULTISPECIES: restriction endonuclease subunit S [unclassified Nostoc]
MIHYGYTASASSELQDVRLLRITDIQNNKVNWTTVPGCEIDESNLSKFKLQEGDLLIARTGGTIGKSYLVESLPIIAVFASYLIRVTPNRLLSNKYLKLFLDSALYWRQLYAKSMGTGQPNVNATSLKSLFVPLPPLAEQKRIVEKCDRLLSICDEIEKRQQQRQESIVRMNESAIAQLLSSQNPEEFRQHWQRICNNFDLLYSVPETIPKLRQAILQLAVQGKLVRQDPNDEPASILLKKIKAQKEQLIKDKKIPKDKPISLVEDSELPYEVNENWNWVRLGELSKLIEYGTSEKSSELGGDIPVFRMNNIRDGKLLFDNLKYVSSEIKDLPRLFLQEGDLLFNRTNSYELVGKTAVFKGETNQYTFASYLIRISILPKYIISDFINLALNSTYFRQTQIEPEITQQCGQANFNGTKLKNTLIPLPPLAEQKRIVEKCDRLMSLCDTLEAKLKQGRDSSEKLMEVAAKQVLTA